MSGEQAASARIDLPASSLLVWRLQAQGRPLSAAQRESAAALRRHLCDAPWTSGEERNWAQVLVFRLELLLGRRKAPATPEKLSGSCKEATAASTEPTPTRPSGKPG
jgi:hypothetical protein